MKRLGTISLSLTRVSDNICHRILICIIAVLVSSSVASAYNPNDYDFEVEGLYYKITGNTEVTLQKVVNPDIEVLSIPSSVIDPDTGLLYSVTRIGDVASGYGTSLKNVTKIIIPESIVQIGSYAFSGCESLESVSISRIINIGIYAFSSCEALKAVEFASKESSMPVSIGDGAFANCKSLIAFKIPEGVVSLGAWAFYNCVNLSNIEIPASLTKIDFYSSAPSFKGCNNLEAITIDTENPKYDSRNGCNAIIDTESNRLILGCGNTVIPNTVSKIGERAFHGCNTLTEIVIPGTVSEIENEAFLDCVNLIDVRSSAMNIGIRAFKNCKNLIRLTLDTSLQRIGVSAFHSCKSLASVEIPKTVVEIGDSAFFSCGLKEIEIPNTITKISDNMFRECRELEKVIIPASVTAFGEDAFASCVSLKSMEIPETVSDIGKGCFFYCQTLSNISIPKTITNIKAYTFNECPKLTNIKLGNMHFG